MLNVGIYFELLAEGENPLPGWEKVSGHLVFDVKMDVTRKGRWVLDGIDENCPLVITTASGIITITPFFE